MSRLSPVSESNSLTLIGTNLILADPSDEASAIEFAICDLIADQYRRAAEERTVSRDFFATTRWIEQGKLQNHCCTCELGRHRLLRIFGLPVSASTGIHAKGGSR